MRYWKKKPNGWQTHYYPTGPRSGYRQEIPPGPYVWTPFSPAATGNGIPYHFGKVYLAFLKYDAEVECVKKSEISRIYSLRGRGMIFHHQLHFVLKPEVSLWEWLLDQSCMRIFKRFMLR